eukprot:1334758-Pyramimonas_sp.AAC.1
MVEESIRIPATEIERSTVGAGSRPGPQKRVQETAHPRPSGSGRAPAPAAPIATWRAAAPPSSGCSTRSSGGRRTQA